jgi:hypothetical protein
MSRHDLQPYRRMLRNSAWFLEPILTKVVLDNPRAKCGKRSRVSTKCSAPSIQPLLMTGFRSGQQSWGDIGNNEAREKTMDKKESNIRARAHAIWESEGRPHGAHDEHWQRAEAEHEGTDKAAAAAEHVHHVEHAEKSAKGPTTAKRVRKRSS